MARSTSWPATRSSAYAIYLGKLLAGFAVVLVLGGVLLPVVAILYGISLGDAWPALVVTVLLGAIGLAAVGTFYAGVTVRMAAREVMLPLLMLPVWRRCCWPPSRPPPPRWPATRSATWVPGSSCWPPSIWS